MTFITPTVILAGTDTNAPTLSATQRAAFLFAFALDPTSGRYVIVDGTDTRAKKYLHVDPASGRLVLDDAQDGSVRMVLLPTGRISA